MAHEAKRQFMSQAKKRKKCPRCGRMRLIHRRQVLCDDCRKEQWQ